MNCPFQMGLFSENFEVWNKLSNKHIYLFFGRGPVQCKETPENKFKVYGLFWNWWVTPFCDLEKSMWKYFLKISRRSEHNWLRRERWQRTLCKRPAKRKFKFVFFEMTFFKSMNKATRTLINKSSWNFAALFNK